MPFGVSISLVVVFYWICLLHGGWTVSASEVFTSRRIFTKFNSLRSCCPKLSYASTR